MCGTQIDSLSGFWGEGGRHRGIETSSHQGGKTAKCAMAKRLSRRTSAFMIAPQGQEYRQHYRQSTMNPKAIVPATSRNNPMRLPGVIASQRLKIRSPITRQRPSIAMSIATPHALRAWRTLAFSARAIAPLSRMIAPTISARRCFHAQSFTEYQHPAHCRALLDQSQRSPSMPGRFGSADCGRRKQIRILHRLALLPGAAVVRVAGENREQGREFAEDHLLVHDIHLAP